MTFWNIILTLVVVPVGWAFNKMYGEIKRLQLVLSFKFHPGNNTLVLFQQLVVVRYHQLAQQTQLVLADTREKFARRDDVKDDIDRIVQSLIRLEDKIDRVLSSKEK